MGSKHWDLHVGRGRWRLEVSVRWRYQAVGAAFNFHSWSNLYPWLDAAVFIGPLMLKIEWAGKP